MAGTDRHGRTEKKNRGKKRPAFLHYAVNLLVLSSLLAAAFLVPQIIFRIQDDILCKSVTLGQRESMDVETLSTSYEKSLAVRMADFAEGLAGNDSFYVTSQELEIGDEVMNYLYSEKGIYQDLILTLVEGGLLSADIWNEEYGILRWKQYVIYSDDYARGVNFILWYIEMQGAEGSTLKLLADGEDGTLYGLKAECSRSLLKADRNEDYLRRSLRHEYVLTQLWGFFATYYEALEEEQAGKLYFRMEEAGWEDINDYLNAESKTGEENFDLFVPENAGYRIEEDRIDFRLPYGETYLETGMDVEDPVLPSGYKYVYPDFTVGVREIYEMIPEFA